MGGKRKRNRLKAVAEARQVQKSTLGFLRQADVEFTAQLESQSASGLHRTADFCR